MDPSAKGIPLGDSSGKKNAGIAQGDYSIMFVRLLKKSLRGAKRRSNLFKNINKIKIASSR
jgi:hypothetical protein